MLLLFLKLSLGQISPKETHFYTTTKETSNVKLLQEAKMSELFNLI